MDAAFKCRALCACPQRAAPKRDVPIVQSGKNFQVPEPKNGETRSEIGEILDGAAALSILRGGDRNDGDVGLTRLVGARKRADVRRFGAAFVNREQAVGVEAKCLQKIPVSMRGPSPSASQYSPRAQRVVLACPQHAQFAAQDRSVW